MNIIQKGLAIAVISLFIGVAIAPSINANVSKESELVEFTTEVCGLDGGKQSVKLTQQEAEEVEDLFDSIRARLNATESREEAEEIFKEAVVELDKYSLLGGLSIKQVQRLISFYNLIQKYNTIGEMSDNENAFCLISGEVTGASFIGPIPRLAIYVNENVEYRPSMFLLLGLCLFFLNKAGFPILFPLRLGSSIIIGYFNNFWMDGGDNPQWGPHPTKGWIWTYGVNGQIKWDGELLGCLKYIPLILFIDLLVGINGFFGLRIILREKTYFFGVARKVYIRYDE